VTTVSEKLAQTIRTYTSRPVLVAPEPYEGARGRPHAIAVRRGARALNWLARRAGISADIWRARLLWFGYPQNLPPLLAILPGLGELSRQYELRFAWIGEDLCAGLRWAMAHPQEVLERIARGQEYVDQKHSPQAIARFWLDVLRPKSLAFA